MRYNFRLIIAYEICNASPHVSDLTSDKQQMTATWLKEDQLFLRIAKQPNISKIIS